MSYFKNCQTVEEIKAEYKRLARLHHPDLGGDTATMQQVNNAYESALKGCNGQKSYDSEGKEHTYTYNDVTEREIIDFLYLFFSKDLPLEASLIGVWTWITGDTKPHKEVLKEMGCLWHSKRGCWYFRPSNQKSYGRGKGGSLEELASKYGVTDLDKFKKKQQPRKAIG